MARQIKISAYQLSLFFLSFFFVIERWAHIAYNVFYEDLNKFKTLLSQKYQGFMGTPVEGFLMHTYISCFTHYLCVQINGGKAQDVWICRNFINEMNELKQWIILNNSNIKTCKYQHSLLRSFILSCLMSHIQRKHNSLTSLRSWKHCFPPVHINVLKL